MPSLRRRSRAGGEDDEPAIVGVDAAVPWALGDLLRDGPAPLVDRPASGAFTVALVLGPGQATPRAAGLPPELLRALENEGVTLHAVTAEEAEGARAEEVAAADVALAAGWAAAPAVLTAPDLRARAVLATAAPAPLGHLGWADAAGLPALGPAWMASDAPLPPGADAAYVPKPVHRREDMVLVHGEEPLGLLAAAELHRRRPDLTFAASGVRRDLQLPFPFLGVDPGASALAHAFASATVAIAPPIRGWRPAALAMLACGQAVVVPDDAAGRAAVGDTGSAALAAGPLEAADAAEAVIDDITLRADRVRAGFALVPGGWQPTAAALAGRLRALP